MNDTLKLCYWIQGFIEINGTTPGAMQWNEIRKRIEACDVSADSGDGSMSAETFMTWIKGFIELADPHDVTHDQWAVIEEHLQLVFTKVTIKTVDGTDDINILEELKKLQEQKGHTPPYTLPPYPNNPLEVICGPGQTNPNTLDTFCLNTEQACTDVPDGTRTDFLDKDNITLTDVTSNRSKRENTRSGMLCSSMPKAYETYLADPVN